MRSCSRKLASPNICLKATFKDEQITEEMNELPTGGNMI